MGLNGDGKPHRAKHIHKVRTFVAAWIANGQNATEAARSVCLPDATPQYLQKVGSTLLAEAREEGYLEHELGKAAHAMGVPELIERTSEVARADVADFVTVDESGGFRFDLTKAVGKTHLIKTLRHDAESGAPIIELYPADAARSQLGKWLGAEKAPPAVQVNVGIDLTLLSLAELRELRSLVVKARALPAGEEDE